MIRRILCHFGRHKWIKDARFDEGSGREVCLYCKKQRMVVHAMMESDLFKLVERGELSFTGYSKAVTRGYLKQSDFEEKDDVTELLN